MNLELLLFYISVNDLVASVSTLVMLQFADDVKSIVVSADL